MLGLRVGSTGLGARGMAPVLRSSGNDAIPPKTRVGSKAWPAQEVRDNVSLSPH